MSIVLVEKKAPYLELCLCLYIQTFQCLLVCLARSLYLGPVVQSIVSLTSSLRVISLTVLADSIHNIMIFFAEKK